MNGKRCARTTGVAWRSARGSACGVTPRGAGVRTKTCAVVQPGESASSGYACARRATTEFDHARTYGAGVVFSLVYVSTATTSLTSADLRVLAEQSRRHNAAADITGVLLYRNGSFLQMLEGDQHEVEALVASIRADSRNHDVTVVRRRDQPTRDFPNWTMGLGEIGPASTGPINIQMPPPNGHIPQTETEAAFLRDLLDLFAP